MVCRKGVFADWTISALRKRPQRNQSCFLDQQKEGIHCACHRHRHKPDDCHDWRACLGRTNKLGHLSIVVVNRPVRLHLPQSSGSPRHPPDPRSPLAAMDCCIAFEQTFRVFEIDRHSVAPALHPQYNGSYDHLRPPDVDIQLRQGQFP